MPVIRTRSYLSDDATLKAHGIDRREVFMVWRTPTDDGMGFDLLIAVDLFSPSHSDDRNDWQLVFTCPMCTIRHILEDSHVGGQTMQIKVFDAKRLRDLDPWTLKDVQTRCSIQVTRGPGSTKEFDVANESLTFEGNKYTGLVTISPNARCPFCPDANDGRQFAVTFPRPGLAMQDPRIKVWPIKRDELSKASYVKAKEDLSL